MKIFDVYLKFIAYVLDKRSIIKLHEIGEDIDSSYKHGYLTLEEYHRLKYCINKCIEEINTERIRKMMEATYE